jgi:ABC-type glutathione transport system ATPase component
MTFKVDIKKIILMDQNGSRTILQNLNFNLTSGRIYTILGKNGSGKSTLIKSLTSLLDRKTYRIEGSAFWNNQNIFLMDYERLLKLRQSEIRYLLQDLTNNFDPLKKLKYYFDNSGVDQKIISSQIKEFLLPEYEIISQLHPYEISGGMAQRISFLLALLPNPQLLILDEPTSAVDYMNVNLVKLKLEDFSKNDGTVLIVTQDINFAKDISDDIAFLQNGLLSDFASKDLFFKNNKDNVYSSFLKSYYELM